jgi:tetratricopeptide (TPR) repeat protein
MTDPREQQFLEVLRHFPGDAMTLFGLASHLRDKGRTEDAISRFRECLTSDPNYGAAGLELGRLLETAGQIDEARQVYADARVNAAKRGDDEIVTLTTQRLEELGEP